jgi:hypothetical protein
MQAYQYDLSLYITTLGACHERKLLFANEYTSCSST